MYITSCMDRSIIPLVNSSEPYRPLLHCQSPSLTIASWAIPTPLQTSILRLAVMPSHQTDYGNLWKSVYLTLEALSVNSPNYNNLSTPPLTLFTALQKLGSLIQSLTMKSYQLVFQFVTMTEAPGAEESWLLLKNPFLAFLSLPPIILSCWQSLLI